MPNLVTAALRGWRFLLATGLVSTIVSAYGCNISSFECGVIGTDGQVRTCSRPGEVCVCETHSCAVRKPEIMAEYCTSAPGDTSTGGDTGTGGSTSGGPMMSPCATGLVYVADYIADSALAGKCVEQCSELASVIDQVAVPASACQIMPPPELTGTSTGTTTADTPTTGTTTATTDMSETTSGTTTSGTTTSGTTTGGTTTGGTTTTTGGTTTTTGDSTTGDSTTSGTTTN